MPSRLDRVRALEARICDEALEPPVFEMVDASVDGGGKLIEPPAYVVTMPGGHRERLVRGADQTHDEFRGECLAYARSLMKGRNPISPFICACYESDSTDSHFDFTA